MKESKKGRKEERQEEQKQKERKEEKRKGRREEEGKPFVFSNYSWRNWLKMFVDAFENYFGDMSEPREISHYFLTNSWKINNQTAAPSYAQLPTIKPMAVKSITDIYDLLT